MPHHKVKESAELRRLLMSFGQNANKMKREKWRGFGPKEEEKTN
jgi:hypothetical protein